MPYGVEPAASWAFDFVGNSAPWSDDIDESRLRFRRQKKASKPKMANTIRIPMTTPAMAPLESLDEFDFCLPGLLDDALLVAPADCVDVLVVEVLPEVVVTPDFVRVAPFYGEVRLD